MKKLFLSLAVLVTVAACTAPQNAAQTIYQLETNYATALTIAVKYKALPSCDAPAAPVLCAKPAVVKQLQDADDLAYPLLHAAEQTVRTPDARPNVSTAIAAAQNAVAAFAAITSKLSTK